MLQCRLAQEFSFGPRALKDALVSVDPALQRLYASTFSPAERLFLAEAYSPQRSLFRTLLIHTAFDWLLSRPEAPEDFETFHAAQLARRQGRGRKHIYLQPIVITRTGCRRACQPPDFLAVPRSRLLPPVAGCSPTLHAFGSGSRAPLGLCGPCGILNFLRDSKPGDALCVLGLTRCDLYPHETWGFTFGSYLPGQEVGVCSFARFSGELLQGAPSALDLAPARTAADDSTTTLWDRGQSLCFSALGTVQCCKVTCHELCHLLGLGSCRWLSCVMQGVLSLDEALRRPLDLCPVCLRKLQHILGFKLVDRYKRLHAWTQAVAETLRGQEARQPAASEDTPPSSADSGSCCESDSEPGTSPSEPLSPDTWTHAFAAELDPGGGLGSLVASEAITEHGRWLARCIRALEREVTGEELARVDGVVDAQARWEMFAGRLAVPGPGRARGRDGGGLHRALGDKLSSLRKRLSVRKLSRAGSSPCHLKAEDS
ncbi:Archaemetzincin-1 [Pteropus alecto]|uniref:Archaemetzincin-1 n=1 Tax=Pteropus alecto TaxID=9402 RepID=L5KEH5_PTEAL|nr:Archaemetzincin-1 [Pteropus alecto]